MLTMRPPSRTFIVNASAHTYAYGPESRGRTRDSATISSKLAANSESCDSDNEVIPSVLTLRLEESPKETNATTRQPRPLRPGPRFNEPVQEVRAGPPCLEP